ncbi:MAG: hypothetical protein KGL39_30010 [Patescibacteria group bacterium]|nr:hypothetical protein [Patescibacteria group bacterium]
MASVKGDDNCKLCPLYKTTQKVCVMGRGPVPCNIMIVGEAPGLREEEVGKPFQGRAGQLLTQMLEAVDLDRESIYITNVVKCRPPGNRRPKSSEINACRSWMTKEIEEVKPRYVLLLGSTALNVMGRGDDKITSLRGRPIEVDGVIYFPTYHPAAGLRDPKKVAIIQQDIKQFAGITRGQVYTNKGFNPILVNDMSTLELALEDIRQSHIVSIDLETSSLSPWRGDVVVAGFGTARAQWVIALNHPDSKFAQYGLQKTIMEAMEYVTRDKKIITQNGKFDALWLYVKYMWKFPIHFDTMVAKHLVDENTPAGLKFMASFYFGAAPYDITSDKKKGYTTLDVLTRYCGGDLFYTRNLYRPLKAELKKDPQLYRFFRKVMMPAFNAFIDVQHRGVYVDLPKMNEIKSYLIGELDTINKELSGFKEGVNWNSSKQVTHLLFDELGLPILDRTKGGAPAATESVLMRLRNIHPLPALLLRYRAAFKMWSSFIKSWEPMIVDSRLHPTFRLTGAVTGRLSCAEPNLQQVPRDGRVRNLITAPPGWTLVESDYSQAELRVAAMLSGDPMMKMLFQTGQDPHVMTAQTVTGKQEISKDERKKAKAVNFGFLYGMGWKKFIIYARDNYDTHFTEEEAKEARRRFFELYKKLRPWHDKQRRIVRRNGYVRALDGRVRHLPNIFSNDDYEVGQAERQAINSPVQGFASDLTLMTLVGLRQRLSPEYFQPVGTVHDAILMEVRNDHLNEVLPIIKDTMIHPSLLDELDIHLTVPLEIEIKVGPWGMGTVWEG